MRKVEAQLASGIVHGREILSVLQRATRTLEKGKDGRLIGGGWGLHKSNTRRSELTPKPNNKFCHFNG